MGSQFQAEVGREEDEGDQKSHGKVWTLSLLVQRLVVERVILQHLIC